MIQSPQGWNVGITSVYRRGWFSLVRSFYLGSRCSEWRDVPVDNIPSVRRKSKMLSSVVVVVVDTVSLYPHVTYTTEHFLTWKADFISEVLGSKDNGPYLCGSEADHVNCHRSACSHGSRSINKGQLIKDDLKYITFSMTAFIKLGKHRYYGGQCLMLTCH